MRRLMSLDTSATRACGCWRCSDERLAEDQVVGADARQPLGQSAGEFRVWKNRRPEEGFLP